MKHIFYLLLISLFLGACGSSKNYLERSNADKALSDAVKKLSKKPSDDDALSAIPVLYKNLSKDHLGKIESYRKSSDISRWDKIIHEYNDLQSAYSAVINSTPAFRLVTPVDYSGQLLESRQAAAEEYFMSANVFLEKEGRDNAKRAYNYYKKADTYVPGYKDARARRDQAFEKSIVNVIINPVQDNSYFFNSSWGNYGYNYSNEYFQQTLIRDLSNVGSDRYGARFYTDWEARRNNVKPDWVVDLSLRNMSIPPASRYQYTQNRSARIQTGTDTSGRAFYQTVTATVYITRLSFNASADMEVRINELATNKSISYRTFREDYRWQEERGSYRGDSRALTSYDWSMLNNGGMYNEPRKEDVLNELYRKIYPQVLNNIKYSVDW